MAHAVEVGPDRDRDQSRDPPDRTRLRQLVDEQAALRRVATLVAGGARPAEVFTAVADELGRLIGAEATSVSRVDHPPGEPEEHEGYLTVATPVVVDGCAWGVTVAATSREGFPAGTEARMADFMELAGMAIANAKAQQELCELADTQAALRRLAMLVARGGPPEAVFAAATREALQCFGGGIARMVRYEPDGAATLVANEGTTDPHLRVGQRWEGYARSGLAAAVSRTGRAARVDDYRDIPGAEPCLREGLRSAIGMPIHVNGQLWGMIAVGSGQGPLPPDAEQRMTQFTDLVATAVANAQNRAAMETSRDKLARLLDEQAALRRVATLVAHGIDPVRIFLAVAEEMRRLLGADSAGIARFDPDGSSVVVLGGVGGDIPRRLPTGTRLRLAPYLAPAVVWRTGRCAQVDEDVWRDLPDPFAVGLRELGYQSMVASPIIVEGRLWGVVNALSRRGPFPPDTAERLTDFTELVATAVGNAESRAEVDASRTRIVAAADETRRRIERDLHDGIQQGLVSLGLQLRFVQSMVPAEAPAEVRDLDTEIDRVVDELTGIVDDLREIARGIHPAILSEGGLRPALATLARRAAITVELDVAAIDRLPEPIEVAAYYVVSEALTNATRHAGASMVAVHADASADTLRVRVRDNGVGGADPGRGSGLVGLKDRIEALGGAFSVHSPPGGGTTVSCALPVAAENVAPDAGR